MKLERLKHSYFQVCDIFHAYEDKAQERRSYNEALNVSGVFQKEVLEALSDLSYTATDGVGWKAREERVYQATRRLISYETDTPAKPLLSPDELLFEISRVTADILASGAERLDFSIFSDPRLQEDDTGPMDGDGNSIEGFPVEYETAPKRAILFQILSFHGIDFKDVSYFQETVGPTKWRKVPYSILHLQNPWCTVLISDEIWEKTYIYPGLHSSESFRNLKKWKISELWAPVGVKYGKDFSIRLEYAIFGNVTDFHSKIPEYRAMIMDSKHILAEAGIIFRTDDGVWDLSKADTYRKWPYMDGKHLRSFPSRAFNLAFGIGDENGVIYSVEGLAKLFAILGFDTRIKNDAEDMAHFRDILISSTEEIEKMGIDNIDGIYHFEDVVGYRDYVTIGGKHFGSFPNATFNKIHGNGSEKGLIRNIEHLRNLFRCLGLRVATPEQELLRWRNILVCHKDDLAQIGVHYDADFDEWIIGSLLKKHQFWPTVGHKKLSSFPNCGYNRVRGIGTKTGMLTCRKNITAMIEGIGGKVRNLE